jgi:hypothetical protein
MEQASKLAAKDLTVKSNINREDRINLNREKMA